MQRIRVLVVDDHRIFAESLAAALAAEQDVEVSAAGSVQAAVRCLERGAADGRRFDVLLIDADLSGPADGTATGTGTAATAATGAAGSTPGTANGANWSLQQAGSRTGPPNTPGTPSTSGPASSGSGSGSGTSTGTGGTGAGTGGIPLVGLVRDDHPGTRTVVLAERDDPRQAASALQAGAGGWVAKDCSLSRLLQVVRGVLKDETHLPPALLTGVLKELTASRKHRTESELLVESLTPREREVLRCMVAGLGRKAVAERLYLSPHTVRTHMQNVLGKLNVHSTLAAVALARRAGVGPVDLEPSTAR